MSFNQNGEGNGKGYGNGFGKGDGMGSYRQCKGYGAGGGDGDGDGFGIDDCSNMNEELGFGGGNGDLNDNDDECDSKDWLYALEPVTHSVIDGLAACRVEVFDLYEWSRGVLGLCTLSTKLKNTDCMACLAAEAS